MKKAAKTNGMHIAMRIGSYQDRELGKDVIEAHNDVLKRQGTVYFGKAGRGLSADKLQRVRNSMFDGASCNLVVIRRLKSGYQCFLAPIVSLPSSSFRPELRFVPSYYHDLVKEIELWIEVAAFTLSNANLLESLALASNSRPLLETLGSCRTSLMLVTEETVQ